MSHAVHFVDFINTTFLLLFLPAVFIRTSFSHSLATVRLLGELARRWCANREKWIFIKPFVCCCISRMLGARDHYFIISSTRIGSAFFSSRTRTQNALAYTPKRPLKTISTHCFIDLCALVGRRLVFFSHFDTILLQFFFALRPFADGGHGCILALTRL